MAVLALSGTTSSGTPPIASKARTWALIQSGNACVQVALAKVKLDAPSTATKICAMRISVDDHGNAVTGVIDKQPLAGSVRLAHRHRQRRLEGPVEFAEPRVAVAAGIGGDIFVP